MIVDDATSLRTHLATLGRGAEVNEVIIADAVEMVCASWQEEVGNGTRSPLTQHTYALGLRRFVKFCRAYDVELIGQITPALLTMWVNADGRNRAGTLGVPYPATIRNRRLVVRAFFAEMRAIHGVLADPTDAVPKPDRPDAERRPVTHDEADALLFFAAGVEVGARAATVALALSGAHTSEISLIRLSGVTRIDDDQGTTFTPGSRRILPRTLPLSGELWRVIERRAAQLRADNPDADPDEILLSRTARASAVLAKSAAVPHNHQAAIGTQLRFVLDLAGLTQADGVRPESLPAYAGRTAFEATGRIEDAARLLGLCSLDHTAKIIGWDWASEATAPPRGGVA